MNIIPRSSWIPSVAAVCTALLSCSEGVLEFRVADIVEDDGARSESKAAVAYARECPSPTGAIVEFTYLAGNSVTVVASEKADTEIPVSQLTRLRVVESSSPSEPNIPAFEVRVVADSKRMEEAQSLRSRCAARHILVSLDGSPVWVEPPWTHWQDDLPGGVFSSLELARRAYDSAALQAEFVPIDPGRLAAQKAWMARRGVVELWYFHCDEQLRALVKQQNPEDYEYFVGHDELFEGIDCSVKPE